MMIPLEWFTEAHKRIESHIKKTPLTYDSANEFFLKWENYQITGSFKARGALNKILSLEPWEQAQGFVAASAGNHGQGVALAANIVGAKATIFASEHAVTSKVEAMKSLGAEVVLVPGGYGEAEAEGLAYAKRTSKNWISPYNDFQVIAGQGTIALEVISQNRELECATWVVPIGGGGLISGIGGVLNRFDQKSQLIGIQSIASPYFHAIMKTGSQDKVEETFSLADGLAGPVERGSITIPLVRKMVNDILLVTEKEIMDTIRYAWNHYGERIEGSAAVPLAAALAGKINQRPLILIISGGNIQTKNHNRIVNPSE